MAASEGEVAAMRRAVALAALGQGSPHPNPLVGAVLLDDGGATLAEGWHARDRIGAPHAEVVALARAGSAARGATMVTTLEPCAHQGSSGPCADALVAAGVRRVVIAVDEPTVRAGGGADRLRAAGVEVETGVEAELARRGNEAWLTRIATGRPFVTLKLATTLDGRVAAADGSARWITSSEARADAHRVRAECDAVAVGVGTVRADDPHLTVRLDGDLAPRQPLRVVVDSTGRTPAGARVLDGAAPTVLITTEDGHSRLAAMPKADVVVVPAGPDGRVDVAAALVALADRDVVHLMVEGGPRLAASVVDAGLVDRVVVYLAPALMGSGPAAVAGGFGTPTIDLLRRLRVDDVDRVGPDVRIVARRPGA
ncbi:MAG TPA: bifunctional diaminohydroxyphosphoribosylaminopyrimidine deaminase/5-amino-6-(5-phosphoribosylamino)uracil reductase RibD [Mycobacteriales bacterium]|nr:bifunctional diaminohydroxyphosphoribosylaminopyrimidine deaminase/5-amino-6-(5-phosphoribosylamino)uracil reductase RibD [Mycobacteriales bacterium]